MERCYKTRSFCDNATVLANYVLVTVTTVMNVDDDDDSLSKV